VVSCSLGDWYQRFGGTYCFHLQVPPKRRYVSASSSDVTPQKAGICIITVVGTSSVVYMITFLLHRSTDSFKHLSFIYSLKSRAKNLTNTATTSNMFRLPAEHYTPIYMIKTAVTRIASTFSVFLISCHEREVYDPLGWKFSLTIKVFYCGRGCSFHIHSTRNLIAAHCTHLVSWSDRRAFEEFKYRHDTRPSCSNSSAVFPTKRQNLQKQILITSSHMVSGHQ
jgi:hypothetical protein